MEAAESSTQANTEQEQPLILIGVTGCVAVYKACEIVRGLQKAGCRVKVVMTENATRFVGPLTFRSLTREPVAIGTFDDRPGDPIHHISLSRESDLFLIAPCTANVVAKIAHGIADDLLTTTALACTAPVMVAPAMNVHMYNAQATQDNLAILRSRGITVIEADEGYLACGDTGKGRLPDPAVIVDEVLAALKRRSDLSGKRVLITAGPTVEPIDAVRFISNPSSGKMGFALAEAALARGAQVDLVSGPVALDDPAGARVHHVKSALDMSEAVSELFPQSDLAVFSSAVSDFRPAKPSERKLKKGRDDEALAHIELVENPDILKSCGKAKREGQVVVGFAAETDELVANAQKKLAAKGADLIVANSVAGGAGFGADTDTAVLVSVDAVEELGSLSKRELADRILDEALAISGRKSSCNA